MTVSVAGRIQKPLALIDLLNDEFGLPKAGSQLFNLMTNLKNDLSKIRDKQWDLPRHDCKNQANVKQDIYDLNDLDITTLAIL